eukprot:359325-Chlamydomonas_euryale.AAC.1
MVDGMCVDISMCDEWYELCLASAEVSGAWWLVIVVEQPAITIRDGREVQDESKHAVDGEGRLWCGRQFVRHVATACMRRCGVWECRPEAWVWERRGRWDEAVARTAVLRCASASARGKADETVAVAVSVSVSVAVSVSVSVALTHTRRPTARGRQRQRLRLAPHFPDPHHMPHPTAIDLASGRMHPVTLGAHPHKRGMPPPARAAHDDFVENMSAPQGLLTFTPPTPAYPEHPP